MQLLNLTWHNILHSNASSASSKRANKQQQHAMALQRAANGPVIKSILARFDYRHTNKPQLRSCGQKQAA